MRQLAVDTEDDSLDVFDFDTRHRHSPPSTALAPASLSTDASFRRQPLLWLMFDTVRSG
jgi:hypothetical protein